MTRNSLAGGILIGCPGNQTGQGRMTARAVMGIGV
eukprot:CAMPEP_0180321146 /NCGR_PEP_ID=MMETSP0988-20121125/35975_1 /TAXON_ID=697907 /ORGANISM="non described non described, Strain CCMP2293" /LENGTH=34 /DNA_ID= /DNA_START= /DNA_END= /DNA_ORIENTATION=